MTNRVRQGLLGTTQSRTERPNESVWRVPERPAAPEARKSPDNSGYRPAPVPRHLPQPTTGRHALPAQPPTPDTDPALFERAADRMDEWPADRMGGRHARGGHPVPPSRPGPPPRPDRTGRHVVVGPGKPAPRPDPTPATVPPPEHTPPTQPHLAGPASDIHHAWSLVAYPAAGGYATDPGPARRPATPLAAAARVLPPPAIPKAVIAPTIPPLRPSERRLPSPPRRHRRRHRWARGLALLAAAATLTLGAGACYLDRSLQRVDALADYQGRVGPTPGVNWLLAGTDTRFATPRADTLILVHIPRHGRASVVSIPRESDLPTPGHGRRRLDDAFALGGQRMLVATLEGATGLHIDHYAQIGFHGFDSVVDDVGGVAMCLPQPMDDPLAGIQLAAGCRDLTGREALGFVRSLVTPPADVARMENQRRFICALLDRITTPSTYLHPTRLLNLARNGADATTVARGDHLWDLARLGLALRDDPVLAAVPIGGLGAADKWSWDAGQADRLFEALATDRPIPAQLLPRH